MHKGKILIGLPVCQEPLILQAFLYSLKRLKIPEYTVFYHFIDDNHDPVSKKILEAFRSDAENVVIEGVPGADERGEPYSGHRWTQKKIWKVAACKDHIITRAVREDFDYLFLIDSDVLLDPKTVGHLIGTDKEIVAEVFWTRWSEEAMEQPQVWFSDFYTQWEAEPGEVLSGEEETARMLVFYKRLRQPGTYEVGGLGACTLIARSALQKGVSFRRIKNVSFWGEDRHFCIRASAMGIDLFVDTHYPGYHIYRPSDLPGGLEFLRETDA